MAWRCRRCTTVPSKGVVGAQPPSRTHADSSACAAVSRLAGSRSSNPCVCGAHPLLHHSGHWKPLIGMILDHVINHFATTIRGVFKKCGQLFGKGKNRSALQQDGSQTWRAADQGLSIGDHTTQACASLLFSGNYTFKRSLAPLDTERFIFQELSSTFLVRMACHTCSTANKATLLGDKSVSYG